jgi:hypothetical protein
MLALKTMTSHKRRKSRLCRIQELYTQQGVCHKHCALRKAHSLNAPAAISIDRNACDLSVPSTFGRKTTEHVVEIGRVPSLAA